MTEAEAAASEIVQEAQGGEDETQAPIHKSIPRILQTWVERGIKPKFHISEQGEGRCGNGNEGGWV